ncbi:MAG: sigma-70 family RNA polymerase sigma factor [Pseudorhodobacter sp.]|nr:sigma-70 family RNA polymerase sigma factor [Pseudorhodobacter sp.]
MLGTVHQFNFGSGRCRTVPYAVPRDNAGGALNIVDEDWSALMVRVRDQRDRAAFGALFGHFAPRVKYFLMRGGASASIAEDCAQDVMATVWTKAAQFDAARASVATWIFTIARNRRIDVLRRDRRPEPEDLDWMGDDEPDQADVYLAAEQARILSRALADLPDKQRALIQRAYYGDLSHSEIAAETGLPLGTIKSRIRLALDRLRTKLSEIPQ